MTLSWILFGIFIVIETLVAVFTWVIRYHVKMFGLPNDPRGKGIIYTLLIGNLLLFFGAGAVFIMTL